MLTNFPGKKPSQFSVPLFIVPWPSQTVAHIFQHYIDLFLPLIFPFPLSPDDYLIQAFSRISLGGVITCLSICGSLLSKPPPTSPVEFWVDASSTWDIGVILGQEWDAWMLRPGWNKGGRDIGWAEFVAIELGLLFAAHQGFSNIHFLVNSDNQGVIHAIEGGKSRNPEQNVVLQRTTTLIACHNFLDFFTLRSLRR